MVPAIAIIGAGSMVFTRSLVSDLMRDEATRNLDLRLVDIDVERLRTSREMAARIVAEAGGRGAVSAHPDRRTAIAGASFVINTIQVGGLRATEIDFDIPERHGIRQTIADTLGIGGISRALRTIPPLLEIVRDIEELAPDAVLLNYSNPMSMLMMAVAARSEITAYGLCHSIPNTARLLSRYLGLEESEIAWDAAGINHMAWFTRLQRSDGTDLYPLLFERSEEPEVFDQDPVRFELMRHFGCFMTESSEHDAEYVSYFLHHPEEVERLRIPIREYLRRMHVHEDDYVRLHQALEGGEPLTSPPSNEFAPPLIASLIAGRDWTFHGNVMNEGLIDNLPPEACVEVPCLVRAHRVHPARVGELPPGPAALDRQCVSVQQLAVEGALRGDRELVYQAAMLDPQASSLLTLRQITSLVDELIAAHQEWLPPLATRMQIAPAGST
jgi:alpha-galactosidase